MAKSPSEASDDSFHSACEDFSAYDASCEPIASEIEAAEYARKVEEEEEEELMLLSRYAGETDLTDWCKCGNCSLDYVVKPEECWCCAEIDGCVKKMKDIGMHGVCITEHEGFQPNCLNTWVLETSSFGLKRKDRKSYQSNRGEDGDYRGFVSDGSDEENEEENEEECLLEDEDVTYEDEEEDEAT